MQGQYRNRREVIKCLRTIPQNWRKYSRDTVERGSKDENDHWSFQGEPHYESVCDKYDKLLNKLLFKEFMGETYPGTCCNQGWGRGRQS